MVEFSRGRDKGLCAIKHSCCPLNWPREGWSPEAGEGRVGLSRTGSLDGVQVGKVLAQRSGAKPQTLCKDQLRRTS